MKTYLFHRIRTSNGETVEEFRAVTADDLQAALREARVDASWECVSESEDYASYTHRTVIDNRKQLLHDLVIAIDDLTDGQLEFNGSSERAVIDACEAARPFIY